MGDNDGMGEILHSREFALVLPVPPSINHLYATVNGRRVLARAGREFKACVADAVADRLDRHPEADDLLASFQRHYLALTIMFYFTSALRRDLDGGLKIAQDALCEALGVNDNLVVDIHLSKRVDRHTPRIEVCLTALSTVQLYASTAGNGQHSATPQADSVSGVTGRSQRRPRRRQRRKQRSLEELAARFKWE